MEHDTAISDGYQQLFWDEAFDLGPKKSVLFCLLLTKYGHSLQPISKVLKGKNGLFNRLVMQLGFGLCVVFHLTQRTGLLAN